MEPIEPDDCYNAGEEVASTSGSAENFQKYMLNIFEKNGILNDLRAYLRSHIVEVLRNAQNGKPLIGQKYFTQRLEVDQQALNILLVEYLLSMQFNYTISVFISEIPLANMVFDYAKKLLCGVDGNECSQLRFSENDIWSVLNFLGVQCDSVYASNVLKMYNADEKTPLLVCLLKSMPMYQKCPIREESDTSDSQMSVRTQDSMLEYPESSRKPSTHHGTCKHMVSCKICRKRVSNLKDKSKKIKEYYTKQKHEQQRPEVENLMQHVGDVENTILGEMFEEMKNVYESEIDMVRASEEKRVQRSLNNHALILNRQREEMELSLNEQSAEFRVQVRQKKQFLSALAASLRGQRGSLAAAMRGVSTQQRRLKNKEDKLKEDLVEAEKVLRKRGEEMREQISKELTLLDAHLESMKRERETINEEKRCLELLKTSITAKNEPQNEVETPQEITQKETDLKKLVDSPSEKCIIETGTVTEAEPVSKSNLLNNEQSAEKAVGRDVSARPSVQQVINDLKRPKNVNFSQTTMQVACIESTEFNRDESHCAETLQRLREENEQLRNFATQVMFQQPAWLPRPVSRPLTAPPQRNVLTAGCALRLNRSSNNVGSGAGEAGAEGRAPRVLSDRPPYIGPSLDRRGDHRRHLITQWRRLGKRLSPAFSVRKPSCVCRLRTLGRPGSGPAASFHATTSKLGAGSRVAVNDHLKIKDRLTIQTPIRDRSPISKLDSSPRDRSPKSLLREAKQRLRNKDIPRPLPPEKREKSPNSVLQEAKQRLRKLEIEAEAVERSYRDFRKRQTDRIRQDAVDVSNLGLDSSKPNIQRGSSSKTDAQSPVTDTYQFLKADYEKCLNFVETYFQQKNTSLNLAKPLPEAILQEKTEVYQEKPSNYIDTPMRDFRKLYNNIEKQHLNKTPAATVIYDIVNNDNEAKREETKKRINFEDTEVKDYETAENTSKPDPQSIDEAEKIVAAKAKSKKDVRNVVSVDRKPSQLKILREDDEIEDVTNGTNQDPDISPTFDKIKELELLNKNIDQLYNLTPTRDVSIEKPTSNVRIKEEVVGRSNDDLKKNMLRIELLKSDNATSKVLKTNKSGKFILTLESSVDSHVAVSKADLKDAAPMSILISPKKVNVLEKVERSKTCPNLSEKETKRRQLKRNDRKASGEGNLCSNTASPRDKSKEYSNDDYTDDFSQDVDNYTSRRELDGSPVSFAKSLEDDNFWEN